MIQRVGQSVDAAPATIAPATIAPARRSDGRPFDDVLDALPNEDAADTARADAPRRRADARRDAHDTTKAPQENEPVAQWPMQPAPGLSSARACGAEQLAQAGAAASRGARAHASAAGSLRAPVDGSARTNAPTATGARTALRHGSPRTSAAGPIDASAARIVPSKGVAGAVRHSVEPALLVAAAGVPRARALPVTESAASLEGRLPASAIKRPASTPAAALGRARRAAATEDEQRPAVAAEAPPRPTPAAPLGTPQEHTPVGKVEQPEAGHLVAQTATSLVGVTLGVGDHAAHLLLRTAHGSTDVRLTGSSPASASALASLTETLRAHGVQTGAVSITEASRAEAANSGGTQRDGKSPGQREQRTPSAEQLTARKFPARGTSPTDRVSVSSAVRPRS